MALGLLETLAVSLVSGAIGGCATYFVQERKLKREYQLHDAAERAAQTLLADPTWRLRTFKVIRHHLGGFEEDELRKILVRSGAVRFRSKSGFELWGLLERNRDRLGVTQIDADPEIADGQTLFPTALKNS